MTLAGTTCAPTRRLAILILFSVLAFACGDETENDYRMVTCAGATLISGGTCGCPWLDLPVDLDATNPKPDGTPDRPFVWPFGVHGGDHPEGHPGWDFTFITDQTVRMPADGTIYEATPNGAEDPEGVDVGVSLPCGLRLYFTPMRVDRTVVVPGRRLARGDRLGTLSYFSNRYFLHFGFAARGDDDGSPSTACPGTLFDPTIVARFQTLVDESPFQEKNARSTQVRCADGTSVAMDFPPEPRACNERLDATRRARLQTCLQPAQGITVW